jgi:hypothetical protein
MLNVGCSNWVFDTCPSSSSSSSSSSRMTLGVLFFSEFEYEKFKDIS